ncbi:hypothetical protein AMS68_005319 [Peltaster fructicola]|uniref:Sugar phosphate transporter domain-containing protein n=1 Tax=Peltaster fructicola TaxID=286661 RepID=A0A6H0XYF2_9PEZI|nr:hypothetical protein AMS68_005319 [Peltaster fructicola]
MDEKERVVDELSEKQDDLTLPTVNQDVLKAETATAEKTKGKIHPAFYISTWIGFSSAVILFNKWILSNTTFQYPIILTTWHLVFATVMTQLMARFTTVLDSRKRVPMTGKVYLRAIMPIGLMFSMSLICSNLTYMYLTVSFIQMLKATTPVAVLLITWVMRISPPSMKTFGNVAIIVLGVIIASYAEVTFILTGVVFQLAGIVFEATRLVMVQKLLSSAEFKMDPLVSLYYFAPACAVMNGIVALVIEVPKFQYDDLKSVGYLILLANAMVAFMLNVSVVFLIGKTSSLAMTLCGVLKDILLVATSMIVFLDPVTPLQAFGYSISLGGLVYYRLGNETIKEHATRAQRAWSDYGARRPTASRTIIVSAIIVFLLFCSAGVHMSGILPQEYTIYAHDTVSSYWTGKTAPVQD